MMVSIHVVHGEGPSVGMMMPKFQQLPKWSCDGKFAKFSCSFFRLMKGSLCFSTCHVQMWYVEYAGPRNLVIYETLVGHVYMLWEGSHLRSCLELVVWGQDFFCGPTCCFLMWRLEVAKELLVFIGGCSVGILLMQRNLLRKLCWVGILKLWFFFMVVSIHVVHGDDLVLKW